MRKKSFLFTLLISLFCLVSWNSAHKFYLSVTQIQYSDQEHSLQMTSRVFIDDLNSLLSERYDIDARFETEEQHPLAERFVAEYFKKKFEIKLDNTPVEYDILGHKRDADVVIFFLEATAVYLSENQDLEVYNALLTDLFDAQQNVVHLKIDQKKKSFLLMKDVPKGVLKLN